MIEASLVIAELFLKMCLFVQAKLPNLTTNRALSDFCREESLSLGIGLDIERVGEHLRRRQRH